MDDKIMQKLGMAIKGGKAEFMHAPSELKTKSLSNIAKANEGAEKIAVIMASSSEPGKYDSLEAADKLLSDCYDYTYNKFGVE